MKMKKKKKEDSQPQDNVTKERVIETLSWSKGKTWSKQHQAKMAKVEARQKHEERLSILCIKVRVSDMHEMKIHDSIVH